MAEAKRERELVYTYSDGARYLNSTTYPLALMAFSLPLKHLLNLSL